ncbi:MAG: hypothetical protein RI955_1001 [Bacteroidota bacterium]|jgi:hypothetical protein
MKKLALLMVAGAMFAACNQAAKTEEVKTDSTATTNEAAAAVAPADSTMHADSTAAPAKEEKK